MQRRAIVRAAFLVALSACGSADPAGPFAVYGSMSGYIETDEWDANRMAFARFDGPDLVIFGESVLGLAVTLRVVDFTLDEENPSEFRSFGFSPANVTGTGFAQLAEPRGEVYAFFSSANAGGSGSVTLEYATSTRVRGRFSMIGFLPESWTEAPNYRQMTRGEFDLAIRP
jgi:hypothetical protein